MSSQLTAPVGSPDEHRKRGKNSPVLVAVGVVGFIVLLTAAGGGLYLLFAPHNAGHNTAGLEGTWRMGDNGMHIHEFRPNGEVACWLGSKKDWWNRLGWSATWKRDGQHVTIRTDRNWDFEGELDGDTIRGKMLMKSPAGVVDQEIDTVWHKVDGRP